MSRSTSTPSWHGITWQDIPGHDDETKKLQFSLLKRGLIKKYKTCAHLEGQALKNKIHEINSRYITMAKQGGTAKAKKKRATP